MADSEAEILRFNLFKAKSHDLLRQGKLKNASNGACVIACTLALSYILVGCAELIPLAELGIAFREWSAYLATVLSTGFLLIGVFMCVLCSEHDEDNPGED